MFMNAYRKLAFASIRINFSESMHVFIKEQLFNRFINDQL